MFTDTTLLVLYLGHTAQIPFFWTKALGTGVVLVLLVTTISLLTMLARALFVSRALVSLSDKNQTVLGKPLLFPVNFTHMRLSPVKDKFSNRFLLIGSPVGLRCRVGNLLAIDDKTLDVSPPPGGDSRSVWRRMASHLSCWFSVDAVRLLHRGDHGVDLREKLDNFLRSQNEDPAKWPYAYSLSVPQFMGWSRSVVSWWYLYNEARELDVLILEINNSYWEKRNIIIRVQPTSDKLAAPSGSAPAEYLDTRHLVRSLPTASRAKFYGGDWHKYIFASPFEKVDGVVSQRMMDPLQACAWTSNASFSNMTTLEETGEVRMATRLTCVGAPIDPTQMNTWDVAKLLFQWTLPGMLTTLEIIFKALKIRFSGKMKMNSKPPVRTGSVGRHVTKLELNLEPFFRAYLARCVEAYPDPVQLTYLPCRSFTNDTIHMRSPSYHGKEASSVRYLTVEPTDPAFYTRIINYLDVKTALTQETQPTGHTADPTAQRLIVSDVPLLTSILDSQKMGTSTPASWKHRHLLSFSRGSSTLSFMDEFALSISLTPSSPQPSPIARYTSFSLRLSTTRRAAFNSQRLLSLYTFLASSLLRWLVLEGLSRPLFSCAKFSSLQLDPKHILFLEATVLGLGYFLVMRGLSVLRDWALR